MRAWIPPLILLAVAAAALWPFSALPDQGIPGWDGPEGRDGYLFLWNAWWLGHTLPQGGNLLHTNLLFAPQGHDLRFHSMSWLPSGLTAAAAVPLGLVRAYNLVLLLGAWLSGLGAFLLARRWCRGFLGPTVAGVLFLLAPARLLQTAGHPNLAFAAGLPLSGLLLLRALERPGPSRLALAILSLVATALCSWYHLVPLAVITLLAGPVVLLTAQGGDRLRKPAGLLIVWIGASLLLLPLAYPLLSLPSEGFLLEAARFSAHPRDLLLPHADHLLRRVGLLGTSPVPPATLLEGSVYLGGITLLICGIGLVRLRSTRLRWILAASGVLLLLSLGPGTSLPLPYRLLHRLPGAGLTRVPARLAMGASLGFALAAGLVVSELRAHRWGRATLLLLALPWMLDTCPGPLPVLSTEVPEPIQALAGEARSDGLHLDIPLDWSDPRLLYYQTVHQRPLPVGFSARMPPGAFEIYAGLEAAGLTGPGGSGRRIPFSPAERSALGDLPAVLSATSLAIHRDRLTGPAWHELREEPTRLWPYRPLGDDGVTAILIREEGSALEGPLRLYAFPGWHPPENLPPRWIPLRWMRGSGPAMITLLHPPAGADGSSRTARLRLKAPPGDAPCILEARVLSEPALSPAPLPLGADWTELVVPLTSGRISRIQLRTDRMIVPAEELPGSMDQRSLGAALDSRLDSDYE